MNRITNRSKQVLVLSLNTGETIHLAIDETSRDLLDVEINQSEKIEKLLKEGSIEVEKLGRIVKMTTVKEKPKAGVKPKAAGKPKAGGKKAGGKPKAGGGPK